MRKARTRPADVADDMRVKKAGRAGRRHDGGRHRLSWLARKPGIEVILIDGTQEAADRGKAKSYSTGILDEGVKKRRKVTEEQKEGRDSDPRDRDHRTTPRS